MTSWATVSFSRRTPLHGVSWAKSVSSEFKFQLIFLQSVAVTVTKLLTVLISQRQVFYAYLIQLSIVLQTATFLTRGCGWPADHWLTNTDLRCQSYSHQLVNWHFRMNIKWDKEVPWNASLVVRANALFAAGHNAYSTQPQQLDHCSHVRGGRSYNTSLSPQQITVNCGPVVSNLPPMYHVFMCVWHSSPPCSCSLLSAVCDTMNRPSS
jgi:hypothetical protein